jgi:selenocysteine lyase/cysteine desulfurase
VHSSTGVKLPVLAIADALGERDAELGKRRTLLCVDAVHGFGVEPEPPGELGCDFLVSGCHKWLFGPRGTGIVWGRAEAWEEVNPTIPSFTDPASFGAWLLGSEEAAPTTAVAFTPGGYQAFEHRWALTAAFAFRQEIGRDRAAERTHVLARRLKDGLAEIPGVVLRTPSAESLSAGLVCCDVPAGTDPEAFVQRLLEEHGVVASLTPYAARYLRFGLSIANSEEEVDRAVEGVRTLAGG